MSIHFTDSLGSRLYAPLGEGKGLERTVGKSKEFSPSPGSFPFPVCSDVAVPPLNPPRTGSSVLPAFQYLYQYGSTQVAAKPPYPSAHVRVWRLFEGKLGEAGYQAGGDRLLRFHLDEGAGTSAETSRLYQDGCHNGTVILVQSRAKRLIRPGSGQSFSLELPRD